MSDKLNILTSNIIRFVAGERPTADKFNAMNQYFSRSIENICRAIGDMYGRSINDPLSPKWNPHSTEDGRALDIATIGRLIGPASNLNPKMFGQSSNIVEEFSADSINNGEYGREIELKYYVLGLNVSLIKASEDVEDIPITFALNGFDDTDVNKYIVYSIKTIGLHPNLTIDAGDVLKIEYTTVDFFIEGGINYLNAGWNVIPDPNQNSKIRFEDDGNNGSRSIQIAAADSGYDYIINLSDYKIESQQSGAVNLRDSEIQSLNNEYNQDKEFRLPSWYNDRFRNDDNIGSIIELPEGLIYLKDLTSKEVYLTATYGYRDSREIYIKDANLCEDHEFCLILTGTDITTSIDDLRNKMFNHRHDGSFGEPFIRIQDLVGKFVTGEFGPSSIPGNEFPMYLHRKGYQTDLNVLNGNNAMLGDIFMGNVSFDGISNTSIDTDFTSHKVLFGNNFASIFNFANMINGVRFGGLNIRYVDSDNPSYGNINIECSNELEINTEYTDVNTNEDVTFDQKNIFINTEGENTQNQNVLNLNSLQHNETFIVKTKRTYQFNDSNDDLSVLNDAEDKFFLSKETLRRNGQDYEAINGLNAPGWPNMGTGTNAFKTRKLEVTNDIYQNKKHFRITFKPSSRIVSDIYPKPYYTDINLEDGFDSSATTIKEYGTAYADIDVEELDSDGNYITNHSNMPVYYKLDPTVDRRRISHFLPIVENSFEFNFKKAAIYDVELKDSASYPDAKTIPSIDYGVWETSTGFSADSGAVNDFAYWMQKNKEKNGKRLLYFNSDLPIEVSYNPGAADAEKYFKDTTYNEVMSFLKLTRGTHYKQYAYGIDEYEVQEKYLGDKPYLPQDDKWKNIVNKTEIGVLLRTAFLAKNELGNSSLEPNISLDDANLSFSLNISYLPGWGDGDYDSRKGIGNRFYLRYLAKNFAIKVIFRDSANELGEGANKKYQSWLIPGMDSSSPLADSQFEFSDRIYFPPDEGSDPDGDGYVTFWNVLKVKADINRLFLRETDVDSTSPRDSVLWERIERGDLKMYLTWIPRSKNLIGNPTDTIFVGWNALSWDDPSGYDEPSLTSYSLGITYDGYHKQARTITNSRRSVERSESEVSLQDTGSTNKVSPMTKIYRSDHLGINCHYLFFPRVLTNLQKGESRNFTFNSIDTELNLLRKSDNQENQFLDPDHRDEGFYIAKYAYGWLSYREDTGDLSSYEEFAGFAEFPNIIFSYGTDLDTINYSSLSEEWYALDGSRKNNESNSVITDSFTDNIRKEIKINGRSMYSGFVSHIDISELIKQYFVNYELRAWTAKNIGYYTGNGGDPFADYTDIISENSMEKAEYGSIYWKEPYKYIVGQHEDVTGGDSDKSATSYHRNIGLNFNLNIKEKRISSNDLLIEIDCLFAIELLSKIDAS